jgi:hypothetical protein
MEGDDAAALKRALVVSSTLRVDNAGSLIAN